MLQLKTIVNVCIVKVESQKNEEVACINKVQMRGTVLLCQKPEDHLKGQDYTATW